MDRNERRNYGRGPRAPRVNTEEVVTEEVVETDRKKITLSRRRNRGGEFLRIDEVRGDRHSTVIIPAEAVDDLFGALDALFPDPGR